jgi:two-component system CheB/CheR fusion protein
MENKKTQKPPKTPAPIESAPAPASKPSHTATGSAFAIVGLGASAGGLEAITQLLGALPEDTGMGFVLVQHLAPTHGSMLAEILGRATSMPVTEVKDEQAVEPNHVYVIPPDRSMLISGALFQLLPRREVRCQPRPLDTLYRSLAPDRRDGHGCHPVRHGERRHPGTGGHQGRGRLPCPRTNGSARQHA